MIKFLNWLLKNPGLLVVVIVFGSVVVWTLGIYIAVHFLEKFW